MKNINHFFLFNGSAAFVGFMIAMLFASCDDCSCDTPKMTEYKISIHYCDGRANDTLFVVSDHTPGNQDIATENQASPIFVTKRNKYLNVCSIEALEAKDGSKTNQEEIINSNKNDSTSLK
jgi:hypothetical protein